MILRTIILLSLLVFTAAGQTHDAKRVIKGDPLSQVYATLGTPVLEYPLKGHRAGLYERH